MSSKIKPVSFEQFARECDKNPSLTRQDVADRLGLGKLQGIAFAARLAAERGETKPPRGRIGSGGQS